MSSDKTHLWWQNGIIYQIYPRSFQDSNGDGIGDLPGITQRLDYLQSINVDAIWLSPIYPSPMHDFGYDVADYTDIHPIFGTMDDFDRLLAAVHERGMKLIVDLVPNHTSDEHPWFIESRRSRDNPKREWYIWRDPAPDGGPPNNWLSIFGGPAWTFDEQTEQYYLHQFVTQQPELNYRHPEVLPAMKEVMRFWLDKGVDGFRVDVIAFMLKDEQFRDNPPNPEWNGQMPFLQFWPLYTQNLPGVHDIIREFRTVLDEYDERMMVGEVYITPDELMKYYGEELDECHLPFNFYLIVDLHFGPTKWAGQSIRTIVDNYDSLLPERGWPNWVLGNHDQHRIASRAGLETARLANMLLLTLRGTPTVYYGDDIGMENVPIPPEKVQDPPALNQPEIAHLVGRDPERTPMQWDESPNAGFSEADVEPWLPVAADYAERNVKQQTTDPTSMLSLFRQLTALRRREPALNVGDYTSIPTRHAVESGIDDIFAYIRSSDGHDTFLILLNFGSEAHTLNLSHLAEAATIAVASDMIRSGDVALAELVIGANEGLVVRVR